ncbi:MAG: hypothetical protein U5L11_02440 [Arhodomonas sp.]|nr:hypothetical protein [Arhodomonas sp.]
MATVEIADERGVLSRIVDGSRATINGVWELPRNTEAYLLTCTDTTDSITDPTAADTAELYKLEPPADCVGMTLKHYTSSDAGAADEGPIANAVLVTIEAPDDLEAARRLSTPLIGAGGITTSGKRDRFTVPLNSAEARSWTKDAVTNVYVAFQETDSAEAKVLPNYLEVEWIIDNV